MDSEVCETFQDYEPSDENAATNESGPKSASQKAGDHDDAFVGEAISDIRSFAASARRRAHAKALSGVISTPPLTKTLQPSRQAPAESASSLAAKIVALSSKLGPLAPSSVRLRASAQQLAIASARHRLVALLGREDGALDSAALQRVSEALRRKRAEEEEASAAGGPGAYSCDGPLFHPYFNARVVHARRSNLRFGPGYVPSEPREREAPPLPAPAAPPSPVEVPPAPVVVPPDEPPPPPPNMYIEVLLTHVAAAASDAAAVEAHRDATAPAAAAAAAGGAALFAQGRHSGLSTATRHADSPQAHSEASSGDGWDTSSLSDSFSGSDSGSWSYSDSFSDSGSGSEDPATGSSLRGPLADAEAEAVLQSLAAAIARHEAGNAAASSGERLPATDEQLIAATAADSEPQVSIQLEAASVAGPSPLQATGAPAAAKRIASADGGRARARELLGRVLQALPAADRRSIARMISLLRLQGRQRGQLRVLRRQAVAWDATHKKAVRNVLLGPPTARSRKLTLAGSGGSAGGPAGAAAGAADDGDVDEQATARARRVAARSLSSDPGMQLRAASAASLQRLRRSRLTRSERLLSSGEVDGLDCVAPLTRAERAARARDARLRHGERERQKLLLGQEQWRRRHGDGGPEGGGIDGARARAASAGARLRRAIEAAAAVQGALASGDDDGDGTGFAELPEMTALQASAAAGRSRSHFATPSHLAAGDTIEALPDPVAAVAKLSSTAFVGRAAVAWGAGARAEAFAAAARARKALLRGIDSQRDWYASQLHPVYAHTAAPSVSRRPRRPSSAPPAATQPAEPATDATVLPDGTGAVPELWQRGRAAVLAWVQQVRKAARGPETSDAAAATADAAVPPLQAALPRRKADLPPPAEAPRAVVKGTAVRMDSDGPRFPVPRTATGEPIGDDVVLAALAIDGEGASAVGTAPDGTLRVVSAEARRVLRRRSGAASESKSMEGGEGDGRDDALLDATDSKSAATSEGVQSVRRGRRLHRTRGSDRKSASRASSAATSASSAAASPTRPHLPVLVGYARMTGRDEAFDPFGRKPLPPVGSTGTGSGYGSARGSVASLAQSSGRRRRDRRRHAAREAARRRRRAAAAAAAAQRLAASFGGKSADTSFAQSSTGELGRSNDDGNGAPVDAGTGHDSGSDDSEVWLEEAVDSAAAATEDGGAAQLHLRPDDSFSARRRRAPALSFARSERFPDAAAGASKRPGGSGADGELSAMAAALGVQLELPQATPGSGAAPSAELLLRPERADSFTRRSMRGQRYTFARRSGRDGAVVGGGGPSAAGAEAALAPGLARHFAAEYGVDEATALEMLRSAPTGGGVSGGPDRLPDLAVLDAAAAASTFGGHGARGTTRGLHVNMAKAQGRPGSDEPTLEQLMRYLARQAEKHAAAEGAARDAAAEVRRQRKRRSRSGGDSEHTGSGKETDLDGHGEYHGALGAADGAAVVGLSDYDTIEFLADRQAAAAAAASGAGASAGQQTVLRRASRPPLVRPRRIRLSDPRPGDAAGDDDATAGFAALQLTADGYSAIRAAGMSLQEFRQVLFGPPDPAVAAEIEAALAEVPSSVAPGRGVGGGGVFSLSGIVGSSSSAVRPHGGLGQPHQPEMHRGSRGGPGARARSNGSNRSSRFDAANAGGSVFGSAGREAPLPDPDQGAAATGASLDDAAAVMAAFTALNI